VGIFTKRNPVDDLKHRKSLLQKQLDAAERRVAEAVDERRRTLLEGDVEKNGGQPIKSVVPRLRDEVETIREAIGEISGRIAEAEAQLAAERDRTTRDRRGRICRSRELHRGTRKRSYSDRA
jgi:hypothetical protein